jgi:hypothetical protein
VLLYFDMSNIDFDFLKEYLSGSVNGVLQRFNDTPGREGDHTGEGTSPGEIIAECDAFDRANVEGDRFTLNRSGLAAAAASESSASQSQASDNKDSADIIMVDDSLAEGATLIKRMAQSDSVLMDLEFLRHMELLKLKASADSDDTDSSASESSSSDSSCNYDTCAGCSDTDAPVVSSVACSPCASASSKKGKKGRSTSCFSPAVVGGRGTPTGVRPSDESLRRFAVDFPLSGLATLRCNPKKCHNKGSCVAETSVEAITSLRRDFWGDRTSPPPNATVRGGKIQGNTRSLFD